MHDPTTPHSDPVVEARFQRVAAALERGDWKPVVPPGRYATLADLYAARDAERTDHGRDAENLEDFS